MEKAMQRIGGKWKLPVLWAMRDGEEIRYSEIKRRVNGITDVMLSQTLKELAEAGLVQRKQYGDVPPRVAYRTTTLAADLFPALQRIAAWGDQL
jgi:DNA-binding HxlR family transcriptional regulator